MIVKPNFHLGFNCRDLDRSIAFYEKYLNVKEKFTLYYGDLIPKLEEHKKNVDPEFIARMEKIKDVRWIVYMEYQDCPGYFIELFNELTAHEPHIPEQARDLNFTHYGHVVDSVDDFYQMMLDKGGEEYVWLTPRPNLDRTRCMWIRDPDGNKFELIEYTDISMELIGRDMPNGEIFY